MATTTTRDEPDYDSSSSSITVPDTSRSWMSNLSFGSHRRSSSISITSSILSTSIDQQNQLQVHQNYPNKQNKPHKANQAAWEAMNRLRATKGQVGFDHFQLIKRVGSGDIGNVYLCQIRTSSNNTNNVMTNTRNKGHVGFGSPCFYAMKVVDKEALVVRNKLKRAEMEKEILQMIDHPFLPSLYADFEVSHYSCLVMDYCPGGDLFAARLKLPSKRFCLSSARFYAAEILLALEYLHMMGIVYRDLKPENVLIREDGHIMLSDFDLSLKCDVVPKFLCSKRPDAKGINKDNNEEDGQCIYKEFCFTPTCATPIRPVLSCFNKKTRTRTITTTAAETEQEQDQEQTEHVETELVAEPINARSKSFVGTHEYLAPEVISGQGHGSAVDWWTLGVFLYEMLYGKTPFKGENNERTLVNILKTPLTFPRTNVSPKDYNEIASVQDLISRLLVKNPKKRMGSINGSVEIKRHEFFKGVNWALIRSVKPPMVPCSRSSNRSRNRGHELLVPKYLSKKEREEPYKVPKYFDYF